MQKVEVVITRNTLAEGRPVAAGTIEMLSPATARTLIEAGKARHLSGSDVSPKPAQEVDTPQAEAPKQAKKWKRKK